VGCFFAAGAAGVGFGAGAGAAVVVFGAGAGAAVVVFGLAVVVVTFGFTDVVDVTFGLADVVAGFGAVVVAGFGATVAEVGTVVGATDGVTVTGEDDDPKGDDTTTLGESADTPSSKPSFAAGPEQAASVNIDTPAIAAKHTLGTTPNLRSDLELSITSMLDPCDANCRINGHPIFGHREHTPIRRASPTQSTGTPGARRPGAKRPRSVNAP